MIYKLLLVVGLLFSSAVAQTKANKSGKINWKKSYKMALKAAKKENKPFLFIISRHTCKYCVVLEETALSDEKVIKTLNENFITHTAYTDDGDYYPQELWQGGTPMIWFLLPNGEPMFQPIPGAIPTEGFVEALDTVMKEFTVIEEEKNTCKVKYEALKKENAALKKEIETLKKK
ncbi:MAG: DUF255 domain-containing protein [Campylobacterota bacterium]|nr:DUF255 domain-containing protein [Campylobacterota bacterium]